MEGKGKMGVYVRYLHAYPLLGSIEVLDGNIPVVRRLEYGQATPYFYAEAPESFRLETEDGSKRWGKEEAGEGGTITWVVTEKDGRPWMIPVQDRERDAEEEEAVLRLVNLAVPALDLLYGETSGGNGDVPGTGGGGRSQRIQRNRTRPVFCGSVYGRGAEYSGENPGAEPGGRRMVQPVCDRKCRRVECTACDGRRSIKNSCQKWKYVVIL